ncbi:protein DETOXIFICATION 34-like isoform X2 [Dioscorea cayenensis subsp. rotundata]|uniref:Protein DETOXIFICATION n=1 Tax=Dioscorea cayennensis subsp. rotundata TaxID=55577 RepID=A0AB40CAW5_DIOCR|nr:protein DETOXIFICATION 34-like isoform X2 [Dioscorea cayenensis subsp. rotundata]
MEAPLLEPKPTTMVSFNSLQTWEERTSDNVEDFPPVHGFKDARFLFVQESKKLWSIATPIAFNILCFYGINSTTQIFVGHLGNLQLSAAAIGLSVISNFSFGFLLGMGSALETLCGQAFGAGQVEMLGVYMQRSWIILLASAVILCPIYLFATPILKLLGQEEQIADAAGKFTIEIIPQMFSLAINFPTQKFLQAQSKVSVLAYLAFAALVMHIGLLALFIYVFHWGLAGAAFAYDISSWVLALGQVVYIFGWCKDGWKGFSWSAFNDMWAFVKLSLASAVMLCLEVWYMMVLVVLTGHLGDAEINVGSLSICMNINGWEGVFFIGINAAISVRVSNELGSGHPRAAKYSVIIVVLQSLLIVTMVLNSIQPVISGVAIGGGWQALVAYINLGCYYIFGLPLGFVLGYWVKWGVEGIWAGMLCGTALQTLILLYIVWRTNWEDEAAQAAKRVRLWGGQEMQVSQDSETVRLWKGNEETSVL